MRIAVVGSNAHVVGGAETYLRWLLPALSAAGHELAYAFEYDAPDPSRSVDASVKLAHRWNLSQVSARAFLDELSTFAPDVVFLQGLADPKLDAELQQRFDSVLFAHAYFGTCLTGTRAQARPERRICARKFGPACLALNYVRGCGVLNPRIALDLYQVQRHRYHHLRDARAVVVASEHMRRTYELHGVDPAKVHVIPYPPASITPTPEAPQPRQFSRRVVYMGRLTEMKGVSHAIRATAIASSMLGAPLTLVIAGDGPELESCRALARSSATPIEVLGWVNGDQRIELLKGADALVVPSLWPEPFGMVGIEAGCLGVPSVGYAAGGIVDWLEPGVSGELGEPFDVAALGAALTRALSSAEHHQRLREGAWAKAQSYGAQQHLQTLLALFEASARR